MRGRYTRAGSASLHLFKGRRGWLDVSIEGRAWLNVAYLQLDVRDRRARAGSVAPLHPLKRQRDSFAAQLGVFLKVERSVPMERLGRAGCRLFAESEVCSHRARAGSVVPLHPLKRQRDSFAARLDVSIEGRACWFAFDELDVACLQNRRCATAARGRGASLPCIPSMGGEVLLLCCWAFLLRVKRVSLLMTSWMLLVYGIGGARLSREGGERRSPAPPQGVARFFCCAVGRFY